MDNESSLNYFGSRYYNAAIGRWTASDPLQNYLVVSLEEETGQKLSNFLTNPQELNAYSYVSNNPIVNVDPEGENIVQYIVKTGDTLSKLFNKHWKLVAEYNKLSNPDLIYPGQKLSVPEGIAISSESDFKTDFYNARYYEGNVGRLNCNKIKYKNKGSIPK